MGGSFGTTRWTRVLEARTADEPAGRAALEELCAAYWPALFAWLRTRGRSEADAADLVQGYFAALFARDGLGGLEREGGRFRDWLLAGLRNHERDEHERRAALKRGGGKLPHSLDAHFDWSGETRRFELAAGNGTSPEEAYERRWAEALLERARNVVRADHAGDPDFDALAPLLDGEDVDRHALRGRGLSAVAIRVRAHRLREKLRHAILAEVRSTLGPGLEPGEELEALLAALEAPAGDSGKGR